MAATQLLGYLDGHLDVWWSMVDGTATDESVMFVTQFQRSETTASYLKDSREKYMYDVH